jgi:hypothetical protein
MLATGEKTPTPARRAAPSSSSPSPSTKKAREGVEPAPVPEAGVGLVEISVGDSSSGGGTAMGLGSGTARMVGGAVESVLTILESDLGGSCVANVDLWDVEAVGSPRVRAMTYEVTSCVVSEWGCVSVASERRVRRR